MFRFGLNLAITKTWSPVQDLDVVAPTVDALEFESCSRYYEAFGSIWWKCFDSPGHPPPSALDTLRDMYGCCGSEVAPTELDTPSRRSVSEASVTAEQEKLKSAGSDEKSAKVTVDKEDKTVDAVPSSAAEKDSLIEHMLLNNIRKNMREHQPCVAVFASEKDQVGSKRPLSETEEPLPMTPSSQATTLAMGATPNQKAKAGLFQKIWEFVFDPTRLLILHVSLGMLAPMVRERRQCRKRSRPQRQRTQRKEELQKLQRPERFWKGQLLWKTRRKRRRLLFETQSINYSTFVWS